MSTPSIAERVAAGNVDLEAIRARAEAATKGPWMAASNTRRKDGVALVGATADRGTGRAIAVLAGTEVQQRHRDAEFIAHARQDIPALLAEIDRLRAELDDRNAEEIDRAFAEPAGEAS